MSQNLNFDDIMEKGEAVEPDAFLASSPTSIPTIELSKPDPGSEGSKYMMAILLVSVSLNAKQSNWPLKTSCPNPALAF
jgi:hypothetical protein